MTDNRITHFGIAAVLGAGLSLLGACSSSDPSASGDSTSSVAAGTTSTIEETSTTAVGASEEEAPKGAVDPLSLPPPQAQESPAIIDRLDRGRQPCGPSNATPGY